MQIKNQKGTVLTYLAIALAVVVAILVILITRVRQPVSPTPAPVDSQVQQLQQQSTSDEIATIEKDLDNTDLDQIDTEFKEVDSSLQSL